MFFEKLDIQGVEQEQNYAMHGTHQINGSLLPSFVHNDFLSLIALTYTANTNKSRFHEFVRWEIAMKMVDKVLVVKREYHVFQLCFKILPPLFSIVV
jgi:hypothetical protein